MDSNALNYWPSNFVQEVANSEGKVYLARTLYGIISGIRMHLEETYGAKRSMKSFGLMLRILKVRKDIESNMFNARYTLFIKDYNLNIDLFLNYPH